MVGVSLTLACGLAAPGEALSACGHFVSSSGAATAGLSVLETSDILAPVRLPGGSEAVPGERRTPCSGLSCRGESTPPLIPAPESSPQHEVWALLHRPQSLSPALFAGLPAAGIAGPPCIRSFPQERPPRGSLIS